VQPGVEFDLERVIDYERSATGELRRVLDDHGRLVFEAHSADYQNRANLKALVEMGHPARKRVRFVGLERRPNLHPVRPDVGIVYHTAFFCVRGYGRAWF
jgi:hypothetical protein